MRICKPGKWSVLGALSFHHSCHCYIWRCYSLSCHIYALSLPIQYGHVSLTWLDNVWYLTSSCLFCKAEISSGQSINHVWLLQPHRLQHARLPCPSATPRACWNLCLSSQWCLPTIILYHALLLLPSIFPCIRGLFQWVSSCIRWPKFWSFSFSISPSNEYSGLISFRIDSFDLLAVQGTLKSLLQHHSSEASIIWCSGFFKLSHPYMTTWKTIALTTQTFVGQVMSLLLNILSRLVITFLPRSKRLLISWLQSPSAVIFGAQENKVCHCFHCFPIYWPWSYRTRCHDLSFLNVEF